MSVRWDWERFEFPLASTEGDNEQQQQAMVNDRVLEDCNPLKFLDPLVSEADFLKSLVAKRKQGLRKHMEIKRRKSIESGAGVKESTGKNVGGKNVGGMCGCWMSINLEQEKTGEKQYVHVEGD